VVDGRANRGELVVAVNSVHVRTGVSGKFHPELLRHSSVDKNGVKGVPEAMKTTSALAARLTPLARTRSRPGIMPAFFITEREAQDH